MQYQPVYWSEGMFLRPHHFQAADRYWTELLAIAQRWDTPYNYGLWAFKHSADALRNAQFEVQLCHARLRDGTLIALDAGQCPGRVDLKKAFEQAPPDATAVTVYLAVPQLELGRRNVDAGPAPEGGRYWVPPKQRGGPIPDENEGGNHQTIDVRYLNVRLCTQAEARCELLPIARIKRASGAESTPVLDEDFIPPLLAVDAWTPLALDIVRAIYDVIGQKVQILSTRVTARGQSLSSQEPGDLDDIVMLSTLNGAYGALRCLAFATGVHPLTVYAELCRIVGALSVFAPQRHPGDIPLYDHDDLARIFKWIKARIEELIDVKPLEYEQRFFVGTARGLQVAIEQKWLVSGWDWYVGVLAESIPDQECRELLRPGALDWKMGSSQQVDIIFQRGFPGVRQTELTQPPRALPARGGWLYYKIDQDPNNAAWKDVFATQTLALRFKEELISNRERLQGQQKMEVLALGKRTVLQFALFAVPPRQR